MIGKEINNYKLKLYFNIDLPVTPFGYYFNYAIFKQKNSKN